MIYHKDGGGHEHEKDGVSDPFSRKTEGSDHHIATQSEKHKKRQDSMICIVGLKQYPQAVERGYSEKGQIKEEP
jgi:hypothetical protein